MLRTYRYRLYPRRAQDKAFRAFFRRLQAGEKPGFPRFKGRHRFHSLEYRHGDGCKLRQTPQGRTVFYVQNVGEVKVKYHRRLPEEAQVKHVVVKRQLGKWYVCLAVEVPDAKPIYVERPAVGRDMGLKSLLALSDGVIVLEKLPLQFMTKNQHLALSAHDAGLGLFQQLLGYKVEEAGSQVVEVDPKYTTQACSGCGALVHKSLKVRVHQCLDCDLGLDRNVNAARNILNLGLHALGRSAQVLTWRVA